MKHNDYPILEFDSNPIAHIEPSMILERIDASEYCVITFFAEVIQKLLDAGELTKVCVLKSESNRAKVYIRDIDGQKVGLMQGYVGAPISAAILEELIALGFSKFLVCGGAGVLDKSYTLGHLIIPISAIRDEGTSYHYAKPSREIKGDPHAIAVIQNALDKEHIPYVLGKTWTTDAFYRETKDKIAQRVKEGCLCVEMEHSALCAVAQFRGVTLGQILYGGDDVSSDKWNSRQWQHASDVRENLVNLCFKVCLSL